MQCMQDVETATAVGRRKTTDPLILRIVAWKHRQGCLIFMPATRMSGELAAYGQNLLNSDIDRMQDGGGGIKRGLGYKTAMRKAIEVECPHFFD